MHFVDCRDTIVASWNCFDGDNEDINNRATNIPGLTSFAEERFSQGC